MEFEYIENYSKKSKRNKFILIWKEKSVDLIEKGKDLNEYYNNLSDYDNDIREHENDEGRISGSFDRSMKRQRLGSNDETFSQKNFYSNLYNQYIYEFREEVLNFKENKEKEIVDILKKFFHSKFQLLNEVNANENNIFKWKNKNIKLT